MRLVGTTGWAKRAALASDRTAAGLRRAARVLGLARRARLPLAGALSLAFGLMLVTTLSAVLAVAIYAGVANTRTLLTDRTNLLLDTLAGRVQGLLQPVAVQLEFLSDEVEAGDLDPTQVPRGHRSLRAVLALAPQVAGVAFVRPDFKVHRYLREAGALPVEDWSGQDDAHALMDAAQAGDPVRWGAPVWAEHLGQTVINAHLPIHKEGRLLGLMFIAVGVETVVRFVDELSAGIGQPVFVLQGRDRVVAHPSLDTTLSGPGRPLPLLAEAGDPVLAAMWIGATQPITLLGDRLRGEARAVEAGRTDWVVVYREIAGFGDRPWVVGTYVPDSVAGIEVRRLWRAVLLGGLCLALAILATLWIGRRMARPVELLAEAAQHIRALDLASVPVLPRSHVLELDRAARAFNAMRYGLAWFEAYVPRRLVRQLMRNPSPDAVASRQLEATVLFTDIVGFSTLAEDLDAAEAAAMLNEHFELLAGCVNRTDGTVDKFLGDGMMAFWGAPVRQQDHARRAVDTAFRIRQRLREDSGSGGGPPRLRLRVGVHTGLALVGNIGSSDRLNYTLVGDTVNIAQRLEQLGKEVAPDEDVVVLLSAGTAAKAGVPPEDLVPLGPRHLRGRDETVDVVRLR